jgi:hypothetical protein
MTYPVISAYRVFGEEDISARGQRYNKMPMRGQVVRGDMQSTINKPALRPHLGCFQCAPVPMSLTTSHIQQLYTISEHWAGISYRYGQDGLF